MSLFFYCYFYFRRWRCVSFKRRKLLRGAEQNVVGLERPQDGEPWAYSIVGQRQPRVHSPRSALLNLSVNCSAVQRYYRLRWRSHRWVTTAYTVKMTQFTWGYLAQVRQWQKAKIHTLHPQVEEQKKKEKKKCLNTDNLTNILSESNYAISLTHLSYKVVYACTVKCS